MHNISIGFLIYDTDNLGDWTQTAAAMYVWWVYFGKTETFKQFLETCISTSYLYTYPITWIVRDRISNTKKPDGIESVVLICNAWWMHLKEKKYNFIPPNWIKPIYTSIHIKDSDILTSDTIMYLKQYEPIGCRDISTKLLLEEKNIKAYFSGCLTMIIDLRDNNIGFNKTIDYSNNTIYIDIFKNNTTLSKENIIKKCQKHYKILDKNNILLVIQDAINYMYAKMVVTTRLHIWLPLVCNSCNVKLINVKTGLIFKNGDTDNQNQKINRFNGLTNIIYENDNIDSFKINLLNDTISSIKKLM